MIIKYYIQREREREREYKKMKKSIYTVFGKNALLNFKK
jgi:hypothetical protein